MKIFDFRRAHASHGGLMLRTESSATSLLDGSIALRLESSQSSIAEGSCFARRAQRLYRWRIEQRELGVGQRELWGAL